MTFIIGQQQSDIFEALEHGTGHLQISALAGTGKSTTAIEMMKRAPKGSAIAIMAFNRSIKQELEAKVPEGVSVFTLNGYGYKCIGRDPRKLNSGKSAFLLMDILDIDHKDPRFKQYRNPVVKLVGIAKGNGLGFKGRGLEQCTEEALLALMDHHGIEGPEIEKGVLDDAGVASLASEVLYDSLNHPRLLDYDDQLWLPVIMEMQGPRFDLLFVDEAQDLNPIQQELVSRALKPGGRLVIIGDANQAIYGFRGADSASMANMKTRFDATELPLSVTWRCATSIVDMAKEIVPAFDAAPNAIEGEVLDFPPVEEIDFEPTDMIVCRRNAPLVRAAFNLLKRKVPFNFPGRDIGSGLIETIKKVNGRSNRDLETFDHMLRRHTEKEVARARMKENEERAQALMDVQDSIEVFSEEADDVPHLTRIIDDFFKEKLFAKNKVTICSIHKSKGLEAPRVFILEFDRMPAKWAKKPHDIQQEMNLKYVAITRAKHTLGIVRSGKKKKKAAFFDWEREDAIMRNHPGATGEEIAEALGQEVPFAGDIDKEIDHFVASRVEVSICQKCFNTGMHALGPCNCEEGRNYR